MPGRYCRICHDEDTGENLVRPCQCTGSIAYVHFSCLTKWIEGRPQGEGRDPLKCELCHAQYDVEWHGKVTCDRQYGCSCTACAHVCEGSILILCLAFSSVALYWVLTDEREEVDTADRVALLLLFALSTILAVSAVRTVYRRWRNASLKRTLQLRPSTPVVAPGDVVSESDAEVEIVVQPVSDISGSNEGEGEGGEGGGGGGGGGGEATPMADEPLVTEAKLDNIGVGGEEVEVEFEQGGGDTPSWHQREEADASKSLLRGS